MQQAVVGAVLFALSLLLPQVLERYMSGAPGVLWPIMSTLCAFFALLIVVLSPPLKRVIQGPRSTAAVSIIGVVILLSVYSFTRWQETKRQATLRVKLHTWQQGEALGSHYRLGVYNAGPGPAENVEVWLIGVDPLPRYRGFNGRFPYRLPTSSGRDMAPRTINEGLEEVYEFIRVTYGEEAPCMGDLLCVEGVDGWEEPELPGASDKIPLMPDELFAVRLQISAANADTQILHAWVGYHYSDGFSVRLTPPGPTPLPQ